MNYWITRLSSNTFRSNIGSRNFNRDVNDLLVNEFIS